MTLNADHLRALPDFLANHDHADQCQFWHQQGTENSCDCGLKEARETAKGIPALLDEVERLRREVDGERDARIVAEGRYHYALLLIDVAERDGDGLAGVAFSAQVPMDLIDGKTDSQIIKLMCSEAFPDSQPLATFEVDEPSDAMIERIKELVPQDQFVADEAIGDELPTSGANEQE